MQARRRAAGEPQDVASISSDEAILLREIRDLLAAQRSV
jgi:large-conductance mechanosensitive channel